MCVSTDRQQGLVADGFRQKDPAIGNNGKHIRHIIQVRVDAQRVALGDHFKAIVETPAPVEHSGGIDGADVAVEQSLLICV